MRNIRVTNASARCIEEALTRIIESFPDTNKGYNKSRTYRKALKQIRNGEIDRQDRHQALKGKKGRA